MSVLPQACCVVPSHASLEKQATFCNYLLALHEKQCPLQFFLSGLLIETRQSKKCGSIGNRTRGRFCLCGNFLGAICSRQQPILLQDLNNKDLKQRRVTQLEKGCSRSGLPPSPPARLVRQAVPVLLWELLRQAQEVKETQGLLQDGVQSSHRPLRFGPRCCREAVSTKVHANPGLRVSLHHSNRTPLLKRVILSAAGILSHNFRIPGCVFCLVVWFF